VEKQVPDRVLKGKRCIFCESNKTYRLADGRIRCKECGKKYSLSKLKKDLEVLHYFCLELSANKTARLLHLDYGAVRSRYMMFREKIAEHSRDNFKRLSGELEIDETYFGGRRKGKRGRGAFNKVVVLGILERNGRVFTKIVPNVKAPTLMREIEEKTEKGSVYYTDCFKSYKSLKQYGKHNKINHQKTFGKGHNYINGLEGFWSFAKERFQKYHGINKNNYELYVKEMEFRYNHRNSNIFNELLKIIYK